MLKKHLALFTLFWAGLGYSFSADTLLIEKNLIRKDLIPFAELYVDHTGDLSLESILKDSLVFVDTFALNQSRKYPVAYWLHLVVETKIDIENARLVMAGDEENDQVKYLIDFIDLYCLNDKRELVAQERSGYLIPRSEKTLQYHPIQVVIPFSAKAEDRLDIYLRIQNVRVPQTVHLDLELRDASVGLPQPDFSGRLLLLAPSGMFIIIGLYVLVFYFFVWDRSYLYFGLFCLLYAGDLLLIEPNGGLTYFLSNHPSLKTSLWFVHFFCLPFLLLFGNAFIGIKKNFPKWHRYYQGLLVLFFVIPIYYVFRNIWRPYQATQPFLFLSFLTLIPICIRFVLSKNWTARLFAIGFFCFLGGNFIGVIAAWHGQSWGSISWTIGQLILLFLFAIGLGYRLLENQRQKANAEKTKELDQLKSRFFTNITHEFRTPLSLILGPIQKAEESVPFTELENGENEIPIKVRHVQLMKRNTQRIQLLVDQLLDLSKIESGKMKLNLEAGAIIKFIRFRVAEFEDIAGRKGIHLMTNYSKEAPNAFFDKDKLEKILGNILSNAIKFTPINGEIRLSCLAEEHFLKITLADNGPGMSKTEMDHIFDRFYQADHTQQQGSGVGMALVKELVELHKGYVAVESQEGKGTTISLTIGINPSHFSNSDFSLPNFPSTNGTQIIDVLPNVSSPVSIKTNPTSLQTDSLVLVVEDNHDLQNYLREILEENHQVIVANNGAEGIKLAIEKIPDFIISDIMMPKVSGIDLCKHLRKTEKTNHIPILLLTAKIEREDLLEGLSVGATDYLTKPFDARALKIKVANLIQINTQLSQKYNDHPLKLNTQKVNSLEGQFLLNVREVIVENLANEFFSVEDLGKSIGYSRSQLFRKLKAISGKSPIDLIRGYRLQYAKALLERGAGTVSEIAYQVGYSHLSYFSKSFKNEFGILPSEIKDQISNH